MAEIRKQHEDLNKYRILIFLGAVMYFAWWFVVQYAIPNTHDKLLHRGVVCLICIIIGCLSYVSDFFKEKASWCFLFCATLVTTHYFIAMCFFGYRATYSSYSLVIIFCVCVSLYSKGEVVCYSVVTIFLTILLFYLGSAEINEMAMLLSSQLTIFPFSYVVIAAKKRAKDSFLKSERKNTKHAKELEVANTNLSNTYKTQQTLINHITLLSGNVADESYVITEFGDKLMQRSSIQANLLKNVTNSMQSIGLEIESSASLADTADELTKKAATASADGEININKLIVAMGKIKNSSNEISKIIDTINAIAFQTNLLALNASVEAARAGKHGKGFAVVANEVRNLAARSAKSADETIELVDNAVNNINIGSSIAEKNVSDLHEINSMVNKAAELMQEIADSSNKQASDINNVNNELVQVDIITAKNVAGTKEITKSANDLSAEAVNVKKILMEWAEGKQKEEPKEGS